MKELHGSAAWGSGGTELLHAQEFPGHGSDPCFKPVTLGRLLGECWSHGRWSPDQKPGTCHPAPIPWGPHRNSSSGGFEQFPVWGGSAP